MSNSSCSDSNPSSTGPTPHANNDNALGASNDAGLQQYVINSIAMFKYAPGDGLVQATDCLVCLNEFRDEEILRLLPNCTHAFHCQCIDLWLKSHVNCPLCRAGIASNDQMGTSLINTERGSSDVVGRIQMENFEIRTRVGDDRGSGVGIDHQSFVPVDVGGLDGEDVGMDIEVLRNMFYPGVNCGFHMHTDLVDDCRSGNCTIMIMDNKIHPSKRSGSMEPSFASVMCFPLENSKGSSTATASILRGDRESGHRRNQSPFKLTGSCSNVPSLHAHPILMKRSFQVAAGSYLQDTEEQKILLFF